MKVAIVGAGISGLSCAIALERHGITPVIFEKRAHVGEALLYSSIWPSIISRPITDPLKYLKREYSLELSPSSHIRKMMMLSPGKRAVERGGLGYIFRRGFQDQALEAQLLHYI
ncbi:MAG TPA: FAD-dependent oxidoreductase, partial [Negativicutes bacterium]|nr:FAD-dependent oxidoreductase [Negativicutes bacterium]